LAVEKAKKSLHKAIDIEPGFLRPLFALVDVYSESGDYETCVDLLQKGLNGSTASQDKLLGHGLMLCRLGEMHMMLNQLQKAMDCFNRALGLNPDLQIAQRSLERLEKQIRDEVGRSPGGTAPKDPSNNNSPDDDDGDAIHDTPSNDSTQSGHYHHPASSRGASAGAMHRSSYGYLPSSSYSLFHSSPS
jgi:tetratricopeptide (TPR) repeat protein